MAQPPAEDRVRPLVSGHAEACLQGLRHSGQPPRPEAVVRTGGGWTVLLVAFGTPPGEAAAGLTDCDRDCLALLAQARQPLSAVRVHRELEQRGIGIWGIATVNRPLARLKRMELVHNSRHSPRGYYLAENLPLFQQLARR